MDSIGNVREIASERSSHQRLFMQRLAYALWLATIVMVAWGCHAAIRAKRSAHALSRAVPTRIDNETNNHARVAPPHAASAAPAPTPNAASAARAAGKPEWTFTPESAEESKARLTRAKPFPNSADARAAREGIRVRLRYHSFYAANRLSPADIARFEQALVGQMDPFANIVGLSAEENAKTREKLARSMDTIVRDTLGEQLVPKMREFIATADFREVADKLAANTFQTDTPLTGPQAERLVQICMECRTDPGNGIRNSPDAVDWNKVLQQAESFLAPGQLTVLQTMRDMRRFDQEFKRSTGLPYRSPVRNF